MCYSQIDEIWEIPDISSPSQKFDSLAASKSLHGVLMDGELGLGCRCRSEYSLLC